MIERITGLPEGVLGFTATGMVTAEDYETTLVPAVEALLAHDRKVRLLYHIGADFEGFEAGALWEDAKVGLKHPTAWERTAVVTEVPWIRTATRMLSFAIPGEVRVFNLEELPRARDWICE